MQRNDVPDVAKKSITVWTLLLSYYYSSPVLHAYIHMGSSDCWKSKHSCNLRDKESLPSFKAVHFMCQRGKPEIRPQSWSMRHAPLLNSPFFSYLLSWISFPHLQDGAGTYYWRYTQWFERILDKKAKSKFLPSFKAVDFMCQRGKPEIWLQS